MSLTVPQAGTIAGRAAQVQLPGNPVADAVGQFGQRMLQVGTAWERERLDLQASRVGVEMTRDLGTMRQEFDQMADPDQINQEWPQRTTALKEAYLKGTDERGRPRVDPRIADRVGLAFDQLAYSHANALGATAIALHQSQRVATAIDLRQTITTQAANADPGTRDTLLAQGYADIDARAAQGIISPAEAAQEKLGLRGEVDRASAVGTISADPQQFLDLLEAGEYPGLSAEEAARFKASAQGDLAAAAAREAANLKSAASQQDAAVGRDITRIIGLDLTRLSAEDRAYIESPMVQAHPDYPKLQAALQLSEENAGIDQFTPAQLDGLIQHEKARPQTYALQGERMDLLKARREKARTGLASDPIGYLASIGRYVPALPDFAEADPADLTRALAARVAFGQTLPAEGWTKRPAYFTPEEAASLKAATRVDQDPARRAAIMAGLTQAANASGKTPAERQAVLKGLSAGIDDPVLTYVGGLQAATGSTTLATEVLRGQRIQASGTVKPLAPDEARTAIYDQLGPVLAGSPEGDATFAEITKSAEALATARGWADASGVVDADKMAQAIHEVMGGQGQFGDDEATGGVMQYRGAFLPLPMGVSRQDVAAVFSDLGGTASARFSDNAQIKAALSAASRDGKPPLIAGQPLSATDLDDPDLYLRAVGNDAYVLVQAMGDGQPDQVLTTDGVQEFRFSLTGLLQAVTP
jgi:hypothetical protein